MKPLLGGKGANLAEMSSLSIPVPPGFTVTTDVCTEYHTEGREFVIEALAEEVRQGVRHMEIIMGKEFGSITDPLLLSVRSGARVSMPGMMDTVLNLGLNEDSLKGLAQKTQNECSSGCVYNTHEHNSEEEWTKKRLFLRLKTHKRRAGMCGQKVEKRRLAETKTG